MGDDQGRWFLVNASPDLPSQIAANAELQPQGNSLRNTPIAGVLLTNADLDHVLGLLALREGRQVDVYASCSVRETISAYLNLPAILDAFCGAAWHQPPTDAFAPLTSGPGLLCRAIDLPGAAPPFAKTMAGNERHSMAYQFADSRTGGRLLVAPDVAGVNAGLLEALSSSDVILFDGTFWSSEELSKVKPNAPKATEMGHVTIKDTSLELLRGMKASQKVLIHINNTNPVLSPDSPERAAVEAAGIVVGSDGLKFEL